MYTRKYRKLHNFSLPIEKEIKVIGKNGEEITKNILRSKILSRFIKVWWQLKEAIYKFKNHYINKFILLLRKSVYPYEYINDCEKFNETWLPEKEDFYSYLNMEHISDSDYKHKSL